MVMPYSQGMDTPSPKGVSSADCFIDIAGKGTPCNEKIFATEKRFTLDFTFFMDILR